MAIAERADDMCAITRCEERATWEYRRNGVRQLVCCDRHQLQMAQRPRTYPGVFRRINEAGQ